MKTLAQAQVESLQSGNFEIEVNLSSGNKTRGKKLKALYAPFS